MLNTRKEFLKAVSGHKIICFGAGRILKQVSAFLRSEDLFINMLLDNSEKKWGLCIEGLEIQSPDILRELDGDEYVILISSKNFAKEIEKQIHCSFPQKFLLFKWPLAVQEEQVFDDRLWWERIYGACMNVYKEIAENRCDAEEYIKEKDRLLNDNEKVIIPRTPLMITTRCSLRCKECSNLMPYYSSPKDYSPDEIIQWIKNVCDAVDEWACCELVGGEPFLYRNLEKVLSYILTQDKIQRIEFTTNASIVPRTDILKLLVNDKVFVKISEYPGLIDYEKLAAVFREYGVHYSVMENMRWSRTGSLEKRNRKRQELQSQYLNCGPAKMCKTILNGKLHVCSKAASLMELGYVEHLETVDLMDTAHLRENIKEFLQMTFSSACDYCDMASEDEEIVEPAIQMDGTVSSNLEQS